MTLVLHMAGVELFAVIHEWPALLMLLVRCLGMCGFRGARCTTGVPLSVGSSLLGAVLWELSLAQWQASAWSVGKLLS